MQFTHISARIYFIGTVCAVIFPLWAASSFDRDLYFGITNDADVRLLQEFLQEQMVYDGPVTGNFLALTRDAVRRFQERESIMPAAGYFGPKTRAHANTLIRENGEAAKDAPTDLSSIAQRATEDDRAASISFLRQRIAELEMRVIELGTILERERQAVQTAATAPVMAPPGMSAAGESTTADTASESASDADVPAPAEPAPAFDGIAVSGASEAQFPISVAGPLKVGDITLANGTPRPLLLSQIRATVTDTMNSTRNRGRATFFTVRDGMTTTDVLISRTPFTFNSNAPVYGPHVAELNMSYPVSLAAGETKTSGVWLEDFEYVNSGTLEVSFSSISATDTVAASGTFRFILTR